MRSVEIVQHLLLLRLGATPTVYPMNVSPRHGLNTLFDQMVERHSAGELLRRCSRHAGTCRFYSNQFQRPDNPENLVCLARSGASIQ